MTMAGQLQRPRRADISEDASSQLQLKRLATEDVAAVQNDKSNSAGAFNDEINNHAEWQVPVIDLAGLADGNAAARGRIVEEVTRACETWGVFQIVNHGVPKQIFQKLDKQARDFFALPMEVKERVNLGSTMNHEQRGFLRRLTPDPLYNSWRENLAYVGTLTEAEAMIDRVWPNGNTAFSESLHEYLKTVEELGITFLEILAEGLDLESNFFSQQLLQTEINQRIFRWRTNFYPPCPEAKQTFGITAHSDPNLLTFLNQDEVCGLQAKKGDRWVDVTPLPGSLVVNVGDSLEAWTNGRFRSVVHRVVVSNTQTRLTWVFLLTQPHSLLVQAPAKLIDDEHPRLFKPFIFQDVMNNLYQKVDSARQSQEPQKLFTKSIFYDFALLEP